jgi:hypothetical protein
MRTWVRFALTLVCGTALVATPAAAGLGGHLPASRVVASVDHAQAKVVQALSRVGVTTGASSTDKRGGLQGPDAVPAAVAALLALGGMAVVRRRRALVADRTAAPVCARAPPTSVSL